MILIIRLCYPSLHSNPKNLPTKAFIFSLVVFFLLSLRIRLLEGKGEEVKAQGGEFLDAQTCSGEGSKPRSWSEWIVIGLGRAHQRDLWKDLDKILALEHLHI